jgi:hypothetical protein
MNATLPWLTLALLGAYHGLNPGMGWLFAVSLGLQERSRAAVLRAFGPIALGHAASIAAVVALVAAAQSLVTPALLQWTGALALVAFGLLKLAGRAGHPRWVAMRVGARDLFTWSFLMATAHGAGLMLVPILLRLTASPAAAQASGHAGHAGHDPAALSPAGLPLADLAAVGLHTAVMFLVMAVIAVIVYDRLGLAILRKAWFNLDRVWAGALIAAGALTLVV